jgi:hypothetical protein
MPDGTETAALCARLEAIVKDVEAQAAVVRPDRPPPPRGGVQGHRLGADGCSCPSARAIVVFPGRGLIARPHRLFNLRRHGRRRTSPSRGCSAQRPPTGEYRP